MKNKNTYDDKRLMGALEHIDDRFIDEAAEKIRTRPAGKPAVGSRNSAKMFRQLAALAACLVLLSAVIPVVSTVIGYYRNSTLPGEDVGSGKSDVPNLTAGTESQETKNDPPKVEQTGTAFDGSPLFRVENRAAENPNRLEAYRADGSMIDLCVCNSTPCTCGKNSRLQICGNMIWALESSGVDKVTFIAYDISDPENIRYTRTEVKGFCLGTHEIFSMNGTPYYVVRQKIKATRWVIEELTVVDMSDAINGNIVCRTYPSYKYSSMGVEGETQILHIDGETVYYGIKDKDTGAITKIARALPDEEHATLLFQVDNVWHFGMRTEFMLAEDGTVHFFREELEDQSEYGYTLYQYIWREGDKVKKYIREINICDYIMADGYIYYLVNDPANSRKFLNYDISFEYNDMTGGVIYRLPVEDTNVKPMVAWELGEEYYIYAVTQKTPANFSHAHDYDAGDRALSSLPALIQGADGGIALWANKQVGENIMHVNLLIGDSENGIVMTELPGCMKWGYYVLSDVGGGSNVNWHYIPEGYSSYESTETEHVLNDENNALREEELKKLAEGN